MGWRKEFLLCIFGFCAFCRLCRRGFGGRDGEEAQPNEPVELHTTGHELGRGSGGDTEAEACTTFVKYAFVMLCVDDSCCALKPSRRQSGDGRLNFFKGLE